MSNSKPPIVVVAFNRPRSLLRLLGSLANAHYPAKDILLIISIDKSDNNEDVLKIANNFEWNFGTKEIKYNETNLGLRKHVLQCGAISQQYDSVIVLEDDLYVSPNFYEFSLAALKFSEDKEYICGISLYNHQLNVHNRENFSAIEDGYDNWYFQFASSWGQVWSKKQWGGFMDWYLSNQKLEDNISIPLNVLKWSDKSWLKYYIVYLIEEKKYFFYPKVSLTTNFSDAGTHIGTDSTYFQVPLAFAKGQQYQFSPIKESKAIYDAFFENQNLHKYLNIEKHEVCIDLHAYKTNSEQRYWLTTNVLNFKILKSFGRSLKPIDANITEGVLGKEIFLYDTFNSKKNELKFNNKRKLYYRIKDISLTDALKISYFKIFDKIRKK